MHQNCNQCGGQIPATTCPVCLTDLKDQEHMPAHLTICTRFAASDLLDTFFATWGNYCDSITRTDNSVLTAMKTLHADWQKIVAHRKENS